MLAPLVAVGSYVVSHIVGATIDAAAVVMELSIDEIANLCPSHCAVVAPRAINCSTSKLSHLMIVVIEVLGLRWLTKDQQRQS